MNLDLVKTNQRFTLGFVPILKARVGDDGKKRLYGIASSTVQDRHGDTMTQSALNDMLEQAKRGLTIFLNHSYEVPEDVAGTVESASLKKVSGDIHDLAMDIVINEGNERAVKAWEAIQSGVQLGLSIGAMIPDGGAKVDRKSGAYTIDHVELVETSIVGVPANPRSWIEYATKALRKSTELEAAAEPLRYASAWTATSQPDGSVTASGGTTGPWVIASIGDLDVADSAASDITDEIPGVGETELPAEAPDPDAASEDEVDETNVEPEARASADDLLALASAIAPAPVIPDATDATVSVETPFANITVDTGNRGKSEAASAPSQEAPESDPEAEETIASDAPPPWLGVPGAPPVQQGLEQVLSTELRQSSLVIARLTRELGQAQEALIAERSARAAVERERDQSNADLTKVLRDTEALLSKLAATPAGRRTGFHEAVGRYEAMKSYYGEDLTEQLTRSIPT